MAKEMMIVFVYDTECCQNEEDDPVSAVLYFHPSWVSDLQKLSLCGQLMGTAHFLRESFFPPKIISLQSGKFVIKDFGRFILAVGTDRNVSESLLEHRANLLTSLIKIYHCNIQTIYDQFSTNNQYKNLSEKLYHIFETYLPILQYNGTLFQNIPILKLPKSGNHIFLEAMQTLQCCQQTKGVLGGTILYHNKIVATQLSSDLTKKLILSDPHRIKSTAEQIHVDFHVPVGIQLIVLFIKSSEYLKLKDDSNRAQISFNNNNNTNLFPFQIKRKMKRDKSLIFSHIPEEETVNDNTNSKINLNKNLHLNRPNHLPLRFKNLTSKDIPESGFSSITFDETDSFPEFIGKTSVVSTPMTENKILLHGDIVSICVNATNSVLENNEENKSDEEINGENTNLSFCNENSTNYINNPFKLNLHNNKSLNDLQNMIKKVSTISLKPFTTAIKKMTQNELDSCNTDYDNYDDEDNDDNIIDDMNLKMYRTITDPIYPYLNNLGHPISNNLYRLFLDKFRIQETSLTEYRNKTITKSENNSFKNFDSDIKILPKTNEFTENGVSDSIKLKTMQVNRKSLTLPIKSLNLDNETTLNNAASMFDSPVKRKKLGGIQLTPLMNKLTILANTNDEKSSGFSSWDTTPGCIDNNIGTPNDSKSYFLKNSSNITNNRRQSIKYDDDTNSKDPNNPNNEKLKKIELFICGQQNMTLFLLLDENSSYNKELIHSMWELCVSRLTKIETNLYQVLNLNVESSNEKIEGDYSYLQLDSKWDTVERGGPWTPNDLKSLEFIHKEFKSKPKFTDILLRGEDSVVYGYQCGLSEIFYQQPAQSQCGLPPPADPMGTIPLAAKRRLERDHSIILL